MLLHTILLHFITAILHVQHITWPLSLPAVPKLMLRREMDRKSGTEEGEGSGFGVWGLGFGV
jgi:hypothetical protein